MTRRGIGRPPFAHPRAGGPPPRRPRRTHPVRPDRRTGRVARSGARHARLHLPCFTGDCRMRRHTGVAAAPQRAPSLPPACPDAADARSHKTLLALSAAAAFGGFAATALRDADPRAGPGRAGRRRRARPWRRCPRRWTASRCRRWRRCCSGSPRRWSACTPSRSCGSATRSPTTRCSGRMFPDMPQERINESLGSGVIVDAASGYVLTNHHVIENADEVSVTLSDGRTLQGRVRRLRPGHRHRADAHPGPEPHRAAAGRHRRRCSVGDFVVAVGNPFGLGQTVTSRHRLGGGPQRHPRAGLPELHPDRCLDQPGQLRRRAGQPQRRTGRHQHRQLQPARVSMAGNIGLGFAIPTNLAREVMDAAGRHRRGAPRHAWAWTRRTWTRARRRAWAWARRAARW